MSSTTTTLAERLRSALAYYHDHKEEIEASFAAEEKAEADHEAKKAEYLRRRSGG